MTVVRVKIEVPADGAPVPADGFLRWVPTARRIVAGNPASIVLPADFKAKLVAGAVDVNVAPSSNMWLWCVMEVIQGLPSVRRYFAVPDVESVDYADLVEVDPATLEPTPGLAPAWQQPIEDLSFKVDSTALSPDPENPGLYLIGA